MEPLLFADVASHPGDPKMDGGMASASWLSLKHESNQVSHTEINPVSIWFFPSPEKCRLRNYNNVTFPWWLRQWSIYLQCGRPRFDPWVRKIPWRREWLTIPVFLPGNPMDRGTWWAMVQGVIKSQTQLSDFTFTFHFHFSPFLLLKI